VVKVRPQRSVWFGIGVVVVFFAAVTLAIGWVGGGGPDIPHSAAGNRAACADCHPADRLPGDHEGRADESCRACHSEKADVAAGAREPSDASRRRAEGERPGVLVALSLVPDRSIR
jgi:hypothetical protein